MAHRAPDEYVGSASEDHNDPVIPAANAKVSFSAPATRGRFSNTATVRCENAPASACIPTNLGSGDGANMADGHCSNCLSFGSACTYLQPALKRGPKNMYVTRAIFASRVLTFPKDDGRTQEGKRIPKSELARYFTVSRLFPAIPILTGARRR